MFFSSLSRFSVTVYLIFICATSPSFALNIFIPRKRLWRSWTHNPLEVTHVKRLNFGGQTTNKQEKKLCLSKKCSKIIRQSSLHISLTFHVNLINFNKISTYDTLVECIINNNNKKISDNSYQGTTAAQSRIYLNCSLMESFIYIFLFSPFVLSCF